MTEITQETIMATVQTGKPYTLLLLKKGPNFDSTAHLQMEHLKHIFSMRAAGQQLLTMPITEPESDLAGIAVFATNKDEAAALTADDPGVKAGRFTFEVISCMGIPGDAIQ